MKKIVNFKFSFLLIIITIFVLFSFSNIYKNSREITLLTIYGENIQTDFKPYIKEDKIYISFDTIKKFIDENIFYDELTSKVIVTTETDLFKVKVGENKAFHNLKEVNIENVLETSKDSIYIPIDLLKDIYNIDVSNNKITNSISIDKKNNDKAIIKFNDSKIYSDIKTDSKIIGTLVKNEEIISYTEVLKHNRWIKVKTKDNIVGYVFKDALTVIPYEKTDVVKDKKDKVVMFWQYGNSLDVLENKKIDVVNVVSPTLYEVSSSNGTINSKSTIEYVNKAKSLGYKVWPIITNGIDSTSYSPADTSLLINSETSRENLIKNILNILDRDNLDGINIDFENMKEADKYLYTQFIRELSPLVRAKGKVISVDMYFVNYIDRKGVGAAADYSVLMGYDQRGAWSNESGSISEISWITKNIESLINDSKIPAEKIILGIPFYTRLWTEKSGESKPTTTIYTMKDAANYVISNKLSTKYDTNAGQNYIEYTKGTLTYKMWLEDSVSVKNRVEVINKYELGGLAAWRKGFETSDIWNTIKVNLAK